MLEAKLNKEHDTEVWQSIANDSTWSCRWLIYKYKHGQMIIKMVVIFVGMYSYLGYVAHFIFQFLSLLSSSQLPYLITVGVEKLHLVCICPLSLPHIWPILDNYFSPISISVASLIWSLSLIFIVNVLCRSCCYCCLSPYHQTACLSY